MIPLDQLPDIVAVALDVWHAASDGRTVGPSEGRR
jgi:hypothetical protein